MTPFITAVVLFAAILHAVWNALVKSAGDRAVTLGLISLGHVVPGALMMFIFPLPAAEAFPFIAASTVIHWGYYYFLGTAYRLGDLSLVYPIARGLTPVLIALGAVLWTDDHLPTQAWIGIAIVSFGIVSLALGQGLANRKALGAACVTSLLIAAYSIVDGIGIRVSGSPFGYIAWLFSAEIFVAVFLLVRFRQRLRISPSKILIVGFSGGLLSGLAYGLVLFANMIASLGIVSALRETSVIFATLIGVVWMGERPASRRLVAATIVVLGIGIMAYA